MVRQIAEKYAEIATPWEREHNFLHDCVRHRRWWWWCRGRRRWRRRLVIVDEIRCWKITFEWKNGELEMATVGVNTFESITYLLHRNEAERCPVQHPAHCHPLLRLSCRWDSAMISSPHYPIPIRQVDSFWILENAGRRHFWCWIVCFAGNYSLDLRWFASIVLRFHVRFLWDRFGHQN